MRRTDDASVTPVSYADLEKRVPSKHPLHLIRRTANDALAGGHVARSTWEGVVTLTPRRLSVCRHQRNRNA